MNDTSHSDAESPDAVSADGGGKSAFARQLILIAILGLMLGALYWDRQVARPGSQAKKEELDQLASERLTTSEPQLSQEEVAEALGRQPRKTREKDGYIIEKFSWRGGLPWRTYDVNVVYSKSKDGIGRYYASFYNEEPEEARLATGSSQSDSPPPTPGDLQGGGPPGGGPPGGMGGFDDPGDGEDSGVPGGASSDPSGRPPLDEGNPPTDDPSSSDGPPSSDDLTPSEN